MVYVNEGLGEISIKIVYIGVTAGDAKKSLMRIKSKLPAENAGDIISISTKAGQTMFFDFLPITLGQVRDFKVNLKLYAAPDAQYYEAPRKLVVSGADAIIFIADADAGKKDQNEEMFTSISGYIQSEGMDIPVILQLNYLRPISGPQLSPLDFESLLNDGKTPVYSMKGDHDILRSLKETVKTILASVG